MQKGFITLVGLLLGLLIIGFLFVRMYSGSETKKSQIQTYDESIQKAEDIKNILETKNRE
jgi:uncharacterized membrane-anchored protein YhcB (DUF1043 family)